MQGPVGVEVQLVTSLPEIRWIENRMVFSRDLSSSAASVKRWTRAGFSWKIKLRFNESNIKPPFLEIWTNQPGHHQEDGLSWSHHSLSSPLPRRWFSGFQANWINWATSKLSFFFFTNLDSRVGSVSSAFAALSFQKIILLRQLSTWGTKEVEYNT